MMEEILNRLENIQAENRANRMLIKQKLHATINKLHSQVEASELFSEDEVEGMRQRRLKGAEAQQADCQTKAVPFAKPMYRPSGAAGGIQLTPEVIQAIVDAVGWQEDDMHDGSARSGYYRPINVIKRCHGTVTMARQSIMIQLLCLSL